MLTHAQQPSNPSAISAQSCHAWARSLSSRRLWNVVAATPSCQGICAILALHRFTHTPTCFCTAGGLAVAALAQATAEVRTSARTTNLPSFILSTIAGLVASSPADRRTERIMPPSAACSALPSPTQPANQHLPATASTREYRYARYTAFACAASGLRWAPGLDQVVTAQLHRRLLVGALPFFPDAALQRVCQAPPNMRTHTFRLVNKSTSFSTQCHLSL